MDKLPKTISALACVAHMFLILTWSTLGKAVVDKLQESTVYPEADNVTSEFNGVTRHRFCLADIAISDRS